MKISTLGQFLIWGTTYATWASPTYRKHIDAQTASDHRIGSPMRRMFVKQSVSSGKNFQRTEAKHILEYQGEKVYFCCDGCKVSFEKDPKAYIN